MEDSNNNKPIIYRCEGANCRKKKGKLLENYIKKYNLKSKIQIEEMDCNNKCELAPVMHLHPEDIWFSEKDLGTILKRYILNNNSIKK